MIFFLFQCLATSIPPIDPGPMVDNFTVDKKDLFWAHGNGNFEYTEDGGIMSFNKSDHSDETSRIQSRKLYFHGHYSSIIKTADCSSQPNAGLNTGYFVFFNNKTDVSGNGLIDNSEIDFEFLCADPTSIYITVYSDFENSTVQYKVFRLVNITTGKVIQYYRVENSTWIKLPITDEFQAIPDFHPGKKFYEYGFDWRPRSVNFWMKDLERNTTMYLWNYTAPDSYDMPILPTYYLYTVRHTTWTPITNRNATEWPTFDPKAYVKEFTYFPLEKDNEDNDEKNDKMKIIIIVVPIAAVLLVVIIAVSAFIIVRKKKSIGYEKV